MSVRQIAGAAVLLVLAVHEPADGAELWRLPVTPEGCRVTLVNELGDVSVGPTPETTMPAMVVRGATELAVDAVVNDSGAVLSIRRAATTPAGSNGVELSVPDGCVVTVRTTTGEVAFDLDATGAPVVAETTTGAITARSEPRPDRTILVATSGEITTDFTIAIEFSHHAEPSKQGWIGPRGDARPGAQGPAVRLTSLQGAVAVLRAE